MNPFSSLHPQSRLSWKSLVPLRTLFPLLLAAGLPLLLTGCPEKSGGDHGSSPSTATTRDAAKAKPKGPPKPSIPDQSQDTAFLAFVGRLRKAVAARDVEYVASVMIPDFGYLLEATPEDSGSGRGVFAFWERNNLWPELELVLQERFVPYGSFMVAPPEFALQEENYHGYRLGIQLVSGGWKFAYFAKG